MLDCRELPKAELHLHIEGTLEPPLMFRLARRNHVELPYSDQASVAEAYNFSNLQSFLDIYYQACSVLIEEQDFYDLTSAYLETARQQGVRHTEVFFDPQTHIARGVPMSSVVVGIHRALRDAESEFGLTSRLILCFLRHLSEKEANDTLEMAMPFKERIDGVGLDSSEVGHPPEAFRRVFARASEEGFHTVAHAGEEGPPEYIWQAIDVLGVERIDHGVRCMEDARLVERLVADQVPLTVCPLSNVRLRVVPQMADHPLRRMLHAGLCVSVHSDDPAYFGGYVADNFAAVRDELDLSDEELVRLARNSFEASFVTDDEKRKLVSSLDPPA